MAERYRVLSSPAFEREFRKLSKGNASVIAAFEELLVILQEDPQNRTGGHKIKKLVGLALGEGQWRIRWKVYRLRYDILGHDVLLHSFRHRREAY